MCWLVFFFKQKTAYEMRISDWSSDVCSSDLKLSEIEGVKHVYSISRPGMAVLTVEYTVGIERQPAIVRLYNQVFSNQDWLPPGVGVGQPLIKPKGIDDVPVMAVTLWTDDDMPSARQGAPWRGAPALAEVAPTLETELKRVPGTRELHPARPPQPEERPE